MTQQRFLVVIADDFGIGPGTSAGILELAARGLVTGSVLLVNSPFAEIAVSAWRDANTPMELGWHPCLTLDGPILPPGRVASLVQGDGRFWPLGTFLKRLFLGRIVPAEVEAELRAQYDRFRELVGQPPTLVNAHHHVNLFHPVSAILMDVLAGNNASEKPLPFLRRIREPWKMLWRIRGARKKRWLLNLLGRPLAKMQAARGFPGADWFLGITDPPWLRDPQFLVRWLTRMPGHVLELTCHPGHSDATLIGRECRARAALLQRRTDEFALLDHPSFLEACRRLGLMLVSPRELSQSPMRKASEAACSTRKSHAA